MGGEGEGKMEEGRRENKEQIHERKGGERRRTRKREVREGKNRKK